ncbi:hypothetical protein [Virgibacillus proomii]|uniref:hypothetical protein n=1 Tax=Virgibacillus proomii TaxID=84407 RepID=UPI001C10619E|nr:hypothetical protein [Virgibacillus proomii]MBU5265723.1 hypothetical protein [Virgibacillus proomii]
MKKETAQVVVKKTVVGWFNVYLFDGEKQVGWGNVSPQRFVELFPGKSLDFRLMAEEVTQGQVDRIFGAGVLVA